MVEINVESIYTSEGLENKSVLWSKYHYIVRTEALRLLRRLPASVELDDLIQAGAIGFLSAVKDFDPKKGVTISAWITQRVKWALLDELRERDWVPRRIRTKAREMMSVIKLIEQEKGGIATEAEIAEKLGITLSEFQQILADYNNSQLYSLEELQESFPDNWENSGDEHAYLNPLNDTLKKNLIEKISAHIKHLPEREQRILQFYYQEDLNMKEISWIIGITETRVSQLHSLAIKRLQSRMDCVE